MITFVILFIVLFAINSVIEYKDHRKFSSFLWGASAVLILTLLIASSCKTIQKTPKESQKWWDTVRVDSDYKP